MSVLGIYGSGGAGRTFYDVASLTNEWEEIVYIDDTVEEGLYRGVLRMPYAVFKQRYPKENSKAQREKLRILGSALYHRIRSSDREADPAVHLRKNAKGCRPKAAGALCGGGHGDICEAKHHDACRLAAGLAAGLFDRHQAVHRVPLPPGG